MEEAKKKKSKSSKLKKSGVRTKFLIESLRNNYYELREENDRLRELVKGNLPENESKQVLGTCYDMSAPREKVNIDDLASKMAGSELDDDEDDDDAVGF